MEKGFQLFPERASTYAASVDQLYFFLIGVTTFFVLLIAGLIVFFGIRYRRRHDRRAAPERAIMWLEVTWTVIPLAIVLFVFAWSARVYFAMLTTPAEGMEVLVTGKQWMWKLQHPTGETEINTLHVPAGEPVHLLMTSEDVIHSFFVPAFRVKLDVLPGRYSRAWFEANRVGTYHLFCAEYCGTKHSGMKGSVVVMEPEAYQRWLAGEPSGLTPVEEGARLFQSLRCASCHDAGQEQRGPVLAGRFGGDTALADGRVARFDQEHVRESMLEPRAKLSAGYEPLMPTYAGQVTESQILQIGAYLRSLAQPAQEAPAGGEER